MSNFKIGSFIFEFRQYPQREVKLNSFECPLSSMISFLELGLYPKFLISNKKGNEGCRCCINGCISCKKKNSSLDFELYETLFLSYQSFIYKIYFTFGVL